ncbi:MAG: VCBS repeat-containing protein, partial [Desulfobacteraceae bacterium]
MKTLTFALLLIMGLLFSGCSSSSSGGGADGDPDIPSIPSNVSAPTLRITLPASWDENWFASASVFDLDADGDKEIIAARHSVLYVWNDEGIQIWRAPVGEPASSANDHGSNRQYASPVVGDLDGDGHGVIAIAYS